MREHIRRALATAAAWPPMSLPARQDSRLPDLPALRDACRIFGVDPTGARLLHHRSNAVYLLPREHLVVRLAPDTSVRRRRA